MNIQQDIESLSKYEHFFHFLRSIHDMREDRINDLAGADKDEVLKIAGCIEAYQAILSLANYDEMKERHRDIIG